MDISAIQRKTGEQNGKFWHNQKLFPGFPLKTPWFCVNSMLTDKHCKNATCPPDKKRARFTDQVVCTLRSAPPAHGGGFGRRMRTEKRGGWHWVARLQKASGQNPIEVRKVAKLRATNPTGDTFRAVARKWYDKQLPQWSPAHAYRSLPQFERDLFPWLGERRMQEIEPIELLATLRKVEARGAVETADRELMLSRQVWQYAVATGRVTRDITSSLKGALTPYRGKHFTAITDREQVGVLLRAIKGYRGGVIVKAAF